MESNGNGSSLWKIIATGLITGLLGFFVHEILGDARGAGTGWSRDQEQKFLSMPDHIDSAWIAGSRERSMILFQLLRANDKLDILINRGRYRE